MWNIGIGIGRIAGGFLLACGFYPFVFVILWVLDPGLRVAEWQLVATPAVSLALAAVVVVYDELNQPTEQERIRRILDGDDKPAPSDDA